MIRFFDVTSAVIILITIATKFKYRFMWLLYAYGCLVFTVLNFIRDLPGQAIMNLIAVGIALYNFKTFKDTDA